MGSVSLSKSGHKSSIGGNDIVITYASSNVLSADYALKMVTNGTVSFLESSGSVTIKPFLCTHIDLMGYGDDTVNIEEIDGVFIEDINFVNIEDFTGCEVVSDSLDIGIGYDPGYYQLRNGKLRKR